ncbi:MAG TPA: hypothetical protein VM734_10155 [Kofleriaceae bacterium]|jgi:gas vesicle protein|nr:hypothetical protein [Kofleriaceae bacterium]
MTDDRKQDAPQPRSAWDDLKRMADEVKVKLHLASMDAKEKWKTTLEPKLQELQQKAEQQGERAADAVQGQLGHVADALKKFVDDLRKDLDIGKKKGDEAEKLDKPE